MRNATFGDGIEMKSVISHAVNGSEIVSRIQNGNFIHSANQQVVMVSNHIFLKCSNNTYADLERQSFFFLGGGEEMRLRDESRLPTIVLDSRLKYYLLKLVCTSREMLKPNLTVPAYP